MSFAMFVNSSSVAFSILSVVAFRPVTSPREDEWREMVYEWRRLLDRIRLWEVDHDRPAGADRPELVAAIRAITFSCSGAIKHVLERSKLPLTAEEILDEIVNRLLMRTKPSLGLVTNKLSKGAQKGLWRKVEKERPGLERWVINEQQEAATTKEAPRRGRA